MKYAGLDLNDMSAAPGVSLTFYTQGCPHRCPGCHNPETWDFNEGYEFTTEVMEQILEGLKANGIDRKLCIMGGEPLCDENLFLTNLIISTVKEKYPDTVIYLWTGYTYEELPSRIKYSMIKHILSQTDFLIDGPYIESERDITLSLRGSRNQNIIALDKSKFL